MAGTGRGFTTSMSIFTAFRPNRVLGVVAGGSLAVSLPWARIPNLVQGIVDSDAIALGVTVVTNYFISAAAVTQALSAALVLSVIYFYVGDIYLERAHGIVQRRGFRALTACTSGLIAFVFLDTQAIGPIDITRGSWMALVIVLSIIGFGTFGLYFLLAGLEPFEPDSELLAVVTSFLGTTSDELFKGIREANGLWRNVLVVVHLTLVGAVFFLPCFFFGLGTVILINLYPLPEVLVLIGLVLSRAEVISRSPLSDSTSTIKFDLERLIYRPLDEATRNLKGALLTLVCLVNTTLYAGIVLTGTTVASTIVGDVTNLITSNPFSVSVESVLLHTLLISILIVVFGAGLSGVFFWLQELRRLPAYAAYWEQQWEANPSKMNRPTTNRMLGTFACGNLLFLTAVLYATTEPTSSENFKLLAAAALLSWFGLGSLAIWFAWRAIRRPPQPVTQESTVIFVSMWFQLAVVLVLMVAIEATSPITAVLFFFGLGSGIAFVVWSPDLLRWNDRREGTGDPELALVYLVIAGIIFGFTYTEYPNALPVVSGVLTILMLLVAVSEIRDWLE